MSLIVLLTQPGKGCGYRHCPTPEASSLQCQDDTGAELRLCLRCLSALIDACQPKCSVASSDADRVRLPVAS